MRLRPTSSAAGGTLGPWDPPKHRGADADASLSLQGRAKGGLKLRLAPRKPSLRTSVFAPCKRAVLFGMPSGGVCCRDLQVRHLCMYVCRVQAVVAREECVVAWSMRRGNVTRLRPSLRQSRGSGGAGRGSEGIQHPGRVPGVFIRTGLGGRRAQAGRLAAAKSQGRTSAATVGHPNDGSVFKNISSQCFAPG